MLKKITPNMMVEDVNKTVDFYRNILCCFELIVSDPKKGQFDWAMIACEDNELMFQSRKSLGKSIPGFKDIKTGGSMVAYIEMEDVEELYNRIKDKVTVIKDLHKTHYGSTEFIIKDCNGYVLVFAELE